MALLAAELKKQHAAKSKQLQDAQNLRLHRAISWLQAAEECPHIDGQFVFLWVAFNAAYATEVESGKNTESKRFRRYLKRIITLDKQGQIYTLLWEHYSGAIRLLLDNQYVFQPYWDWANSKPQAGSDLHWQDEFKQAKARSHKALANKDVSMVLSILFTRLYTLRNQLIHGGATFNSSANRAQVNDACQIMGELVPLILQLMLNSTEELWADAIYPFISE